MQIAHPWVDDRGDKWVAVYGFPGPVGDGTNLTVTPATPGQRYKFCYCEADGATPDQATHPDGMQPPA